MGKGMDTAIQEFVDGLVQAMPDDIRKLRQRITGDLYNGPTYFDENDNEVTCFDEGAKAFPFMTSVKMVRRWIHDNWPCTVWYNDAMGEISECAPNCDCDERRREMIENTEMDEDEEFSCHCFEDWCEVDLKDLINAAFDRETSHYLR